MKLLRVVRRCLPVFVLACLSFNSFSQVDKEFWFSCPYVNKNHAVNYLAGHQYLPGGGQPILLRMSTLGNPAVVTISTPANANGLDTVINIPANSTATLDLLPYRNLVEVSQTVATILNGPENKGIHIVSSDFITAYYENATIPNPEIFSLKGSNALGTEFYTPFQTHWPNDPLHDYHSYTVSDSTWNHVVTTLLPDSAFSAFDIVATTDNTVVTITPTTNVVGHPANVPFQVTLMKGQTYSVRQLDQAITTETGYYQNVNGLWVYKNVGTNRKTNNLSGSHVSSNHPIAVSVKDDSVFPSEDAESGACEDYIGDQIIPVNVIGTEYVVMKGALDTTLEYGSISDWLFIVGVKDGTTFTITGSDGSTNNYTIDKGITLDLPVTLNWEHILASDSIYVFHVSGYDCEFASAVLPPLNTCTGSNDVGFVRTYGTFNEERFFVNVLVRQGGEKSFTGTDPTGSTVALSSLLNAATFTPIPNSAWSITQMPLSRTQLLMGAHELMNTKTYFHLALIYSTVYAWTPYLQWNDNATVASGNVPQKQGASYGYFSNFNKIKPKAIISSNNKNIIQVPIGNSVRIVAQGGFQYSWTGFTLSGGVWTALPTPYYLNKTSGYNPIFTSGGTTGAPVGQYMYRADISPVCEAEQIDSVFIQVIPPITFNNIVDSICPDTVGGTTGSGYNLNNLTDSIVGTLGQSLGYGVASWFYKAPAGAVILDDAESNRNVTYNTTTVLGTLTNPIANPDVAAPNTSPYVVQLDVSGKCTGANGVDIIPNSPMSFSTGSKFSLQVRSYTSDNNYATNQGADQPVTMILWDGTTKVSVSQNYLDANWKSFSWQTMTFDFSSFTTINNISKITIQFPNPWCGTLQYQFDNLIWQTVAHNQKIYNPTNYTVHNKDSVFALVTNPAYPNFSDTAKVTFVVASGGKAAKNITLPVQCSSQTTCVDLTQYNNQVGGAVVASKVWYWDKALTLPVHDSTCVNVSTSTTFYAQILDKCTKVGSVAFNISPGANVRDSSVTLCGEAGGATASVVLDNYVNWVKISGNINPVWYADADTTQRLSGSVSMTVSDQQVVYAKVSTGLCDRLAQLTFNVTLVPTITINPTNVCVNGGAVTLNAKPVGGTFTGAGISGVTFTPTIAGAIPFQYKDSIGACLIVDYDTIQVYAAPTVTTSITGQASPVTYNTSTQLQATVTGGTPAYTYSWTPTAALTSATVANPTTTNLTVAETYCVTVSDANACQAFSCIPVAVNNTPLTIDLSGLKDICLGQTVTLPAPSGGVAPYTISWSATDGFTSTATNPTDVPATVGSVTYSVTVTDATPTTITKSATINVNALPSVTFANTAPVVCQNTPLTLAPTITGTVAGTTYLWTGAPVVLAPTNTNTEVIDVTQNAGTYPVTLKVDNQNGCAVTSTVLVKIDASPTVTITPITGFCSGTAKTLHATVTGGTTPITSLWTGNFMSGDLTPTNSANPVFTSTQLGYYNFTYSATDANGCSASATISNVQLAASPQPVIVNGSAFATCANTNNMVIDSKILNPVTAWLNPSQYQYSWSGQNGASAYTSTDSDAVVNISSARTIKLTLTVTDPHGCSDTASTVVTVNPLPYDSIIANRSVCQGQDLTVSSFTKSANYTYNWTGNASVAPYLTPANGAAIETFNSSTPSTQYILGLTLTNKTTGCVNLDTIHINVLANPSVVLHDTTICYLSSFMIHPLVTPLTNISSSWSLDTVALNGSHNILTPTFTADSLRNYKLGLQVTSTVGCVGSDTMTIHVTSLPTADAGPSKIMETARVQFPLNGSASNGTPAYTYQWSPAADINGSASTATPWATITSPQTFTLTVTDKNGCKGVDSIFVNLKGPLGVTINASPICGQQTVTLQALASGGDGVYTNYKYTWYQLPNTTTVVGTDSALTVSVSATTSFEVSVTDNGQTVTSTKSLVVNPLPVIAINPISSPEKVCQGSNLVMYINNPLAEVTYTWSDGSALTTIDTMYTFMNNKPKGTYSIFVSATNAQTGCSVDTTVTIKVNPLPTVAITPANPSTCAASTLLLTAIASPNTSISWTEGTNSTVLYSKNPFSFEEPNQGSYNVHATVTDGNGCMATATDTVSVGSLPPFRLPETATACAGTGLPLNINPNNAPNPPTITFNGISDDNYLVNKTANPPVFESDVPGNFFVIYKVDDGTGCPRTDTIHITVYSIPVVVVTTPLSFCSGSSTALEIDASGNATSYLWSGDVTQSQGPTTYFKLGTPPGTYTVTVTGAINSECRAQAVSTITVYSQPVVYIPNFYDPPKGGEITLTGSASGGKPPYTGQWLPAAYIASVDPKSNGFTATSNPIYFNHETFTLQVTDSNGCTNSLSITDSTVNGIVAKIIANPTNIKADSIHPINPTKYPKGVLDSTGLVNICLGDSVTLLTEVNNTGSGNYSYKWMLNGKVVDTLAYLISKPTKSGSYSYTLQLTDNLYHLPYTTEAFTVDVHDFPVASIATNPSAPPMYVNEQIVLIGKATGSVPFTYQWTGMGIANKDTVITTYESIIPDTAHISLKVTDKNGCAVTVKDTLFISPLGKILVNVSSANDSVCNSGTLSNYMVTNAQQGVLYNWTITGPSNVQFFGTGAYGPGGIKFVDWDNSAKPGVYTITVSALNKQTTTFTVTVFQQITASNIIQGPQNVCENQQASYSISNLPSGSNVTWSINNGSDNKRIITPNNLDTITVQWGPTGNQVVSISAGNAACSNNLPPYPVTVHPNPVANFAFAPLVATPGDSIYSYKEVKFTNLSYLNNSNEIPQNTGLLNYYWDFIGDGIYVDRDFEPTYSFDQVGVYNTTLMAVDTAWGCRDTFRAKVPVVMNPNCALKYPNVFTPDDSKSAKFTYGYSNGLVDNGYELQIYNRWGQLIWETNSRYDKWDGTFNGAICKQDVYVYHSKATCENGKVIKISGNVTLLK